MRPAPKTGRAGRGTSTEGAVFVVPKLCVAFSAIGPRLRQRQEGVPEEIKEIAWKGQIRLHKRYLKLTAAGKDKRRSSPRSGANCWASSGPSGSKRKRPASCSWRHDEKRSHKGKSKNFPKTEKTKTIQRMNNATQVPFVDKRNERSLIGPLREGSLRSYRHRNRQMTWSPVDGITGSSSVEEESKPSLIVSHQRSLVELVLSTRFRFSPTRPLPELCL